ncbi:MAG TPA: CopG family antitoxin [Chloroflexota bacterium]|jgi:hypothetical protein
MTTTRSRTTSRGSSRIPEFTSIEEEAAWWDSHDIADYQDELRIVPVRAAKKLSEGITIRLEPDALAELHARARKTGVPPATLACKWLLDHLSHDEDRATAGSR